MNPFQVQVTNLVDLAESASWTHVHDFSNGYLPSTRLEVRVLEQAASALFLASGGASGAHETSHVIDGDHLVLCVGPNLVCAALPGLELLWQVEADSATCFQVFQIPNGYIVHGELAISCVSRAGEILWSQGGRDIFVFPQGGPDFAIGDGVIWAKDWNGDEYQFAFDGSKIALSPPSP